MKIKLSDYVVQEINQILETDPETGYHKEKHLITVISPKGILQFEVFCDEVTDYKLGQKFEINLTKL